MAIFRGTGGTGDSTTDTTVTTVTEKAAEAASSATSAANSATSASNSATSAETSATNAATSETNAATSESNASTSATSAETAKTAAEAAQTAAETAETNAETAEANAVTAKNQAVSAKDNAVTAQTAAETAETNAETAYSNTLAIFGDAQDVQDAVDSASASATTATTKATEAATSATNAANSATSAGTSETNAASSASQAATSANTAGSHATDAETAQTAAETAQAAAEAAEANINGLYLGSLADDPTLDGNGVAVTTGDLYFNTTEQEVRVYTDGDVWEPVVDLAGDITVNSLTSNNDVVVKGNLEVQGTTITVDSATAQTIDLGDNDKIRLGDSDDLQIYHDGLNSYIHESGTGSLFIQAYAGLVVRNPIATEKILEGYVGGAVSLYYDNSKKLATTSTGIDITGNITVSGTVDGRDIAADGATLDTALQNISEDTTPQLGGDLDTNGNDIQFGDNDKAVFGAGDDLQIYHDDVSNSSYIADEGGGRLRLRSNPGVTIQQAINTEKMAEFEGNGAVTLYYDNSEKLATTSSGVDVTGTLVSDGLTVQSNAAGNDQIKLENTSAGTSTHYNIRAGIAGASNDGFTIYDAYNDYNPIEHLVSGAIDLNSVATNNPVLRITSGGDAQFYEDTGTTAKLTWDASAEELQFKDNVKAEFGDGGDLNIQHNGTNSFFVNGTGQLTIRNNAADKDVLIETDDGSGGITDYIRADGSNGEVQLYHYGSEKLATKSTGIDVTGTVTADGLTVDGATDLTGSATITGSAPRLELYESDTTDRNARIDSSGNKFNIKTIADDGGSQQTRIEVSHATGDISFYDDAGTSQDFYWDASTSRLGLGTTSPSAPLEVAATATTDVDIAHFSNSNAVAKAVFRLDGAGSGKFTILDAVNNEDVVLRAQGDSYFNGGNVGIGTTSPSFKTEVNGDIATKTSGNASVYVISGGTTNQSRVYFGDNDSQIRGRLIYDHSDDSLQTFVSGSERMRIDSSGNLLVGTTDNSLYNNTSGEGVGLIGGDHIEVARSGGPALFLNRMTSDGTIANFLKDGSTVGSIGTDGGLLTIGESGQNQLSIDYDTATTINGVRLQNSGASGGGIILSNNGGVVGPYTDATIDLGNNSQRFQSLYLSGGVYLGGTGSANLLDDYEEGTWTPSVPVISQGPTLGASATRSGRYTKVGRIVHCQVEVFLNSTDVVAIDDRFVMGNLPFAVNSGLITGVGTGWMYSSIASGVNAFFNVGAYSASNLAFYVTHVDGSPTYAITIKAEFTYETSA